MASLFTILGTLSLSLLCICRADLISDVCSATIIPDFCTETLRSDQAARAAPDAKSLGLIVIRIAKSAIRDLIAVTKKIGGPRVECVEMDDSAIEDLDEILDYLTIPDSTMIVTKDDFLDHVSGVNIDMETCEDDFRGGEPAPADLKAATDRAERTVMILYGIGNKLFE
ncbi:Plant invertase/pectin methylesterase inhibitor superfamily protein [Striga hermonthica]|uniref:Plant invertase/pectin methylesterase inhibitor superfamily protein n=1 Tax=Striga hermonthica TaxID=68872 RepID=A0A9N7P321_STRHE|nr:Plant invertase/pectin methylesterase inhibitor superfamily protein [Striga hermonthica]